MDRLDALAVFVEVAQHKSFSRAAEVLYLQRSAVSMKIKALETRLQVRLFHRTTRQVELTSEGYLFYQHAREVLNALEQTENLFSQEAQQVRGRLRVDMTLTLAERVIIPKLQSFLETYPQIQLELSSADRHVDLIHEGIDCAIRVGWGQEEGLTSRAIGEMPLLNCASPAYLARYGEPKTLADLEQHYLVGYVQRFGGVSEKFEYFDGKSYKNYKMRHLIQVNSVGAYKSACLEGLGICQIPITGIKAELQAGLLLAILPDLQAEPMPLRWVFPYPQSIPPRVQVFMRWFEPLLRAHLNSAQA